MYTFSREDQAADDMQFVYLLATNREEKVELQQSKKAKASVSTDVTNSAVFLHSFLGYGGEDASG
jgi:hypothetical protein